MLLPTQHLAWMLHLMPPELVGLCEAGCSPEPLRSAPPLPNTTTFPPSFAGLEVPAMNRRHWGARCTGDLHRCRERSQSVGRAAGSWGRAQLRGCGDLRAAAGLLRVKHLTVTHQKCGSQTAFRLFTLSSIVVGQAPVAFSAAPGHFL